MDVCGVEGRANCLQSQLVSGGRVDNNKNKDVHRVDNKLLIGIIARTCSIRFNIWTERYVPKWMINKSVSSVPACLCIRAAAAPPTIIYLRWLRFQRSSATNTWSDTVSKQRQWDGGKTKDIVIHKIYSSFQLNVINWPQLINAANTIQKPKRRFHADNKWMDRLEVCLWYDDDDWGGVTYM